MKYTLNYALAGCRPRSKSYRSASSARRDFARLVSLPRLRFAEVVPSSPSGLSASFVNFDNQTSLN